MNDKEHGPPAPVGASEYIGDERLGVVLERITPEQHIVIELGESYQFDVLGRLMTGTVLRYRKGFVTLRTKKATFTVPIEDVLRRAR